MRAVRAVLTAAQNLKQRFPDELNVSQSDSQSLSFVSLMIPAIRFQESSLILRSLIDVNLPKFLAPDIPLFEGIVGDLFPQTKPQELPYEHLMVSLSWLT